jgi:hypothetical protein
LGIGPNKKKAEQAAAEKTCGMLGVWGRDECRFKYKKSRKLFTPE